MKIRYWNSIEINKEETIAFEQYLKTITRGLQFTTHQVIVYKTTEVNTETITYYIAEEIEYLQAFIKHRYPQIGLCNAPNANKVTELKFKK